MNDSPITLIFAASHIPPPLVLKPTSGSHRLSDSCISSTLRWWNFFVPAAIRIHPPASFFHPGLLFLFFFFIHLVNFFCLFRLFFSKKAKKDRIRAIDLTPLLTIKATIIVLFHWLKRSNNITTFDIDTVKYFNNRKLWSSENIWSA